MDHDINLAPALERVTASVAETQRRRMDLERELGEAQNVIAALRNQSSALEMSLRDLQTQLDTTMQAKAQEDAALGDIALQKEAALRDLAALRSSIDALLSEKERSANAVTAAYEAANSNIDSVQSTIESTSKAAAAMAGEVKHLRDRLSAVREAVETADRQLGDVQNKSAAVNDAIALLRSDAEQIAGGLSDVRKRKEDADTASAQLEAIMKALQQQRGEAEKATESMRKVIESRRQQTEAITTQMQAMSQLISPGANGVPSPGSAVPVNINGPAAATGSASSPAPAEAKVSGAAPKTETAPPPARQPSAAAEPRPAAAAPATPSPEGPSPSAPAQAQPQAQQATTAPTKPASAPRPEPAAAAPAPPAAAAPAPPAAAAPAPVAATQPAPAANGPVKEVSSPAPSSATAANGSTEPEPPSFGADAKTTFPRTTDTVMLLGAEQFLAPDEADRIVTLLGEGEVNKIVRSLWSRAVGGATPGVYRLIIADALNESGDFKAAMTFYNQALATRHLDPFLTYLVAASLFTAAKSDDALKLSKLLAREKSGKVLSRNIEAIYYMRSGKLDEAERRLSEAVATPGSARSHHHETLYNMAVLQQKKGDTTASLAWFEKLRSSDPNYRASAGHATPAHAAAD